LTQKQLASLFYSDKTTVVYGRFIDDQKIVCFLWLNTGASHIALKLLHSQIASIIIFANVFVVTCIYNT